MVKIIILSGLEAKLWFFEYFHDFADSVPKKNDFELYLW